MKAGRYIAIAAVCLSSTSCGARPGSDSRSDLPAVAVPTPPAFAKASAAGWVGEEGPPERAYPVEGELRDFNNEGVTDARVTLIDKRGATRTITVEKSGDGAFRFFPVTAGHYSLEAEKLGFRPNRRELDVPGDGRVLLVLLPEPKE